MEDVHAELLETGDVVIDGLPLRLDAVFAEIVENFLRCQGMILVGLLLQQLLEIEQLQLIPL